MLRYYLHFSRLNRRRLWRKKSQRWVQRESHRARKGAHREGQGGQQISSLDQRGKPSGAGWPCDPPAAQILGHGCPAAEQVGSQRFQPLPQPHHGGQRLSVAVQHGVLLLDVDQGLFVHVLQKLFGLLRYLWKKLPQSVWRIIQLATPPPARNQSLNIKVPLFSEQAKRKSP